MSEPFNLDALLVEEEDAPPFTFVWGGKTYHMPLMPQLPFERQLALETATDLQAVGIILGDDLANDLADTLGGPDKRPLSIARFGRLLDAWFAHQGLERGKSPASSASSAPMVRPSRRTSRSGRGRGTS